MEDLINCNILFKKMGCESSVQDAIIENSRRQPKETTKVI